MLGLGLKCRCNQGFVEYLVKFDVELRMVLVVLDILSCDDLSLSEDGLDRLAACFLFNKLKFDGHLSILIDNREAQVIKDIELLCFPHGAACDNIDLEGCEFCAFLFW